MLFFSNFTQEKPKQGNAVLRDDIQSAVSVVGLQTAQELLQSRVVRPRQARVRAGNCNSFLAINSKTSEILQEEQPALSIGLVGHVQSPVLDEAGIWTGNQGEP
jgi:hypothetical protein